MIELFKLISLPHTQKIRKIIKILEVLEYECLAYPSAVHAADIPLSCDLFYMQGLLNHAAELYPADSLIAAAYTAALQEGVLTVAEYRTVCNKIRHALYRQSGVQPSEWDLVAPGTRYGTQKTAPPSAPGQVSGSNISVVPEPLSSVGGVLCREVPRLGRQADGAAAMQEAPQQGDAETISVCRPFYPGLYVYAEDIRAPFNLGSIFRTAEAFGAEKLFVSEDCVSPDQPRAQRSAMGCTRFLPWERCRLEQLPAGMPVFALETGGTPITSFPFPQQGIVLLGSEELGLSAEALKKASAGIVSIPMKGIKASLNVAVAFGILMQYWTASLQPESAGAVCGITPVRITAEHES